jgi:hypothetical protein
MQLVAYGAQDVYLTGNPQITFFKVVYRRHTNFAMEVVELTMNGNPNFGKRSTVTLTRNGDLVTKLYLRVELAAVRAAAPAAGQFAWVRRLGHALIQSVEIEIGGAKIDRQYGHWLEIWYELTHTSTLERGYAEMIGDVPTLTGLSAPDPFTGDTKPQYTLFIPLQFWFCRNTGLALPLIALQYHEIRLTFEFTAAERLVVKTDDFFPESLQMRDATLLVDYVYLDSEERRRFAQVGHEYLIEQLQFTGEESATQKSVKVKLGFNHPCKELVWALRNGNFLPSSNRPFYFLGYTEKDDWSTAVQRASDNIATGMVALFDPLSLGTDYEGVGIDVTGVSVEGTYEVPYGGDFITVDLSLPDDASFAPGKAVGIHVEVLVAGTVDYGTKLRAIRIEVIDATNYKVVATEHTLTIRDISIPVSSFVVDNRLPIIDPDTVLTNRYTIRDVAVYQYHNFGMYLDGSRNPVQRALIQLNGHERFDEREGRYFNYVQPDQHHTRTPADGINVYSFGLHPEQHQPSGTCNLSRIDTTQLNLALDDGVVAGQPDLNFLNSDTKLYIYAFSYNVLRVMSGMGGLAYSN